MNELTTDKRGLIDNKKIFLLALIILHLFYLAILFSLSLGQPPFATNAQGIFDLICLVLVVTYSINLYKNNPSFFREHVVTKWIFIALAGLLSTYFAGASGFFMAFTLTDGTGCLFNSPDDCNIINIFYTAIGLIGVFIYICYILVLSFIAKKEVV